MSWCKHSKTCGSLTDQAKTVTSRKKIPKHATGKTWDFSISDLDSYKLSNTEVERRKDLFKSKNLHIAKSKSSNNARNECGRRLQGDTLLNDVVFEENCLQDILDKTDNALNAVGHIFSKSSSLKVDNGCVPQHLYKAHMEATDNPRSVTSHAPAVVTVSHESQTDDVVDIDSSLSIILSRIDHLEQENEKLKHEVSELRKSQIATQNNLEAESVKHVSGITENKELIDAMTVEIMTVTESVRKLELDISARMKSLFSSLSHLSKNFSNHALTCTEDHDELCISTTTTRQNNANECKENYLCLLSDIAGSESHFPSSRGSSASCSPSTLQPMFDSRSLLDSTTEQEIAAIRHNFSKTQSKLDSLLMRYESDSDDGKPRKFAL